MQYFKAWLQLKTDRRGVTAMEYGLITAIMAVAIIAGVTSFGGNVKQKMIDIGNKIYNTN